MKSRRAGDLLDLVRIRAVYGGCYADYPVFRWQLDHIFHELSFALIRLERLQKIGSDHFPVLAELQYEPKAEARQDAPEVAAADHVEARQWIAEAREPAEEPASAAGENAGYLCRLVCRKARQ